MKDVKLFVLINFLIKSSFFLNTNDDFFNNLLKC